MNSYVDADFLRQTVKDHVDAICDFVLDSHLDAKFELLWPLDVNDPNTRRLNRYINLPVGVGAGNRLRLGHFPD